MARSKNTGRSITLPLHHFFGHLARCASAASLAAFLQSPAFFSSCTKETAPPAEPFTLSLDTKSTVPEAVDLFFFDTTGVQLLDSYQQITNLQRSVYGLSGTGVKRLVALSGKAGQVDDWNRIRTYGDLRKHSFSLERDSARSPLLYGMLLLPEGASRQAVLELHPLLTAIRLRSVSCDFSERPYAQNTFHNLQIFLSYAGSEGLPLEAGDGGTVSWLNPGWLDSVAVRRLPEPEMLWQDGCGEIGPQRIYPEKTFYCYPGADTHLVLAGTVGYIPCYYPIPLGALMPDTCVQLDITLLRMGSPSPDIPTVSGAFILETQTLPWEEREPYTVTY
jgi:hypothetical protein